MKVKLWTVVRTLLVVAVVICQAAEAVGIDLLEFAGESPALKLIFCVIIVIGSWYNNSWTKEAIEADEYKDGLKEGDKILKLDEEEKEGEDYNE